MAVFQYDRVVFCHKGIQRILVSCASSVSADRPSQDPRFSYPLYIPVSGDCPLPIKTAGVKRPQISGDFPDQNKGSELPALACRIIRNQIQKFRTCPVTKQPAFSQDFDSQIVGIHNHHRHPRFLADFVTDSDRLTGNADPHVFIRRDILSVESVQPPDFTAQHSVKSAADSSKRVKTCAARRQKNFTQAAIIDGKLHFRGQTHPGARRRPADETGQDSGPDAGSDLFLRDDPPLTQGDNFLTGEKNIPRLVNGFHIFLDQIDIAFPDLHKMRCDGMAGIASAADGDHHLFPSLA